MKSSFRYPIQGPVFEKPTGNASSNLIGRQNLRNTWVLGSVWQLQRQSSSNTVAEFGLRVPRARAARLYSRFRQSLKTTEAQYRIAPPPFTRNACFAIFRTLRTFHSKRSIRFAMSSFVGSRPSSCTRAREVRINLLIVSKVMSARESKTPTVAEPGRNQSPKPYPEK